MKRTITNLVAYGFLAATILTGLAWYNNINMSLQWDPTNGHGRVYHGPISWLDWTAVDFSTASTFIPFFGCLLIAVGLFRTANARKHSDVSDYFPFFKSYNSIMVALGLIGTVWGLIMIGYYDATKVKMSDLILCLRTALFSTLIALIWVFLFVIPVRFIMRWWHKQVSGYVDEDTDDVISVITDTLGQLKRGLGDLIKRISEFNTQLPAVKSNIEGINGAVDNLKEGIGEVVARTGNVLEGMNSSLQAQQRVAEEQRKAAEAQQRVAGEQHNAVQRLTRQINNLEQQRKSAEARAAGAEAKLATIKKTLT